MHKRVTKARYHFGSWPIIFKQKQKDTLAVKKYDFSFSPLHTVSLHKDSIMLQCHSETTNLLGSLIHRRKFLQRSEKITFHLSCYFYNLLLILLCKQIQLQSHVKKSFRARAYSLAQAIQLQWPRQSTGGWLQLLSHLLQQNTSDKRRQHTTHICPGTALCMREVSCPPIPTCLAVLVSS